MTSDDIIYYALWFTFPDGEKTTNIISKNPSSLITLHNISISNPDSLFHTYKNNIKSVTVDPIKCFKYIHSKLEYFKKEDFCLEGKFYALQYNPFCNSLQENLVYLSLEEYNNWKSVYAKKDDNYPSFFNDVIISNEVIHDTYYEDGIINA